MGKTYDRRLKKDKHLPLLTLFLFFTLVCGFVRQGFLFVRQKALKLWQYAVCQYREFAGNVPVVQYF